MNELALFAGAGGGLLASKLLGFKTVCAVENNHYCIERLMQRQNEGNLDTFPIWNDVHTFQGKLWKGRVDIITGGFPCQAFSTATHGISTADDLWPQMDSIIEEVKPRLIFAENVSIKAISTAAQDCSDRGYHTQTLALSAEDLGADHRRQRYWLLAYTDDGRELLSRFYVQTRRMQELLPSDLWLQKPYGWEESTAKERYRLGEKEARQMGGVVSLERRSSESNRSGMADGVARWVDRYRAIGNGQTSVVAAAAFCLLASEAIKDLENKT